VLFRERPVLEVSGSGGRGIALGLAISVATGFLLFAARASAAIENSTFQVKMLLLAAAAVFHFAVQRNALRRLPETSRLMQLTGALGVALWLGVALAGCAFILLE
jgi:hypothetical protein